jgi:hypothetical protein
MFCPSHARPAALFLPLAAAAYSLRCIARFLNTVLLHDSARRSLGKLTLAVAQQLLGALTAVDHLVLEMTQLAVIGFGCGGVPPLQEGLWTGTGPR